MVQTTIRFPAELYHRLKKGAKERGLTLNAYVVSALWDKVNKNGGQQTWK